MALNRFVLLMAAFVFIAPLFLDECSGQARPGQKQPKAPERNIPAWTEVSGNIPENKLEAKKAGVFEYFSGTVECRMEKPLAIYFYWPDEGKMEKTAYLCSQFEKTLGAASNTQTAFGEFGCYKCNAKNLDKKLASKLGVKVPLILLFDATGKKVHSITKISSDKSLAKKLGSIKKASDKAVEKASKKEEGK